MAKENTMTWSDMKTFVNSMTDEELNEKVICWREEEAIEILSAERLEEDYGIMDDDQSEGLTPRSVFEQEEDYKDEDFTVVKKKGFPLLHENF